MKPWVPLSFFVSNQVSHWSISFVLSLNKSDGKRIVLFTTTENKSLDVSVGLLYYTGDPFSKRHDMNSVTVKGLSKVTINVFPEDLKHIIKLY